MLDLTNDNGCIKSTRVLLVVGEQLVDLSLCYVSPLTTQDIGSIYRVFL